MQPIDEKRILFAFGLRFYMKSVVLFRSLSEEFLFGDINMPDDKKIEWAKEMLVRKAAEIGRIPLKTDFEEIDRARIKAFLGPWPRALEKAGLKEVKEKCPSGHK